MTSFNTIIVGLVLLGACLTIVACKHKPAKESISKEKGPLQTGMQAPDFSLPDQDGQMHNLTQYRGKKVVLYFYPKDGTPGCTKEACSLRDGYTQLKRENITILGVSYDSPQAHKHFIQTQHLPFSLLSDEHKEVAGLYGAKGLFMPKRVTFLINEHGVIVHIFHDVDVANHAQAILDAFKGAA